MKKLRPFRFGLETGGAASRQEWLDKARKMEDLGYSTVLLEDHLFCAFAPLAAMVSAAEVTSTLRIGTYGRLELGIGTGYFKSDYERSGISLQPPGVRVERFKEAVQVMKGFFSGEPFSFEGQYY